MSNTLTLALSLCIIVGAILVFLWLRDAWHAFNWWLTERTNALFSDAMPPPAPPLRPRRKLPGSINAALTHAKAQTDADTHHRSGPEETTAALRERAYWKGELPQEPAAEPATTRNGGARIQCGQVIQLHRSR